MNTQRKYLPTILALLAALLAAACILPNTETAANTSANVNANASEQKPAPTAARPTTFRGRIGDALEVEMKLRREADSLAGSYFYTKVKKEIALRGTIGASSEFTLQEFDPSGKQTGLFKGTWSTSDTGNAELKGRWSRPDGSRAQEFTLEEVPVDFASGASLVSKEIKKKEKKLKYEVDVSYPQIVSTQEAARFESFNREAREIAEGEVKEFEGGARESEPSPGMMGSDISGGYDVGLANDDLISVLFSYSTYYSGAAHPNHHTRAFSYDFKSGRALKLADLFKPDALYLRAISDYCIKDLKKQFREQGIENPEDFDTSIEEGAAPNADNYQSWLITRGGLEIIFDPYQVAPYAAGSQRVLVPYSVLKDLIDPRGPVAQFIK